MAKNVNRHYAMEELVDLVREQASPDQIRAMDRHLASGCARCRAAVELWNRVNDVARREPTLAPPSSAVQHVRQAFAIAAEKRRPEAFVQRIARLVFASAWQPAFAGVRSGTATPQRVLYRSRAVSIEINFEPEPRSEHVNLTGQLTTTDSGGAMPPIHVVLSGNGGQLAATSTNGFGEFSLTFVPEDGLRLSMTMANSEELLVPLEGSGLRIFYRN
jgi:hypothetical protein